jgi:hypothetical protein
LGLRLFSEDNSTTAFFLASDFHFPFGPFMNDIVFTFWILEAWKLVGPRPEYLDSPFVKTLVIYC